MKRSTAWMLTALAIVALSASPLLAAATLDGIEAKLDDETSFTSDDEYSPAILSILTRIVDVQNDVLSVKSKVLDDPSFLDDGEFNAYASTAESLLNTIDGKLDDLEAKLDDETDFVSDAELTGAVSSIFAGIESRTPLFTDDTEFAAGVASITALIDDIETKLDDSTAYVDDDEFEDAMDAALVRYIERALADRRVISVLYLPQANGGHIE